MANGEDLKRLALCLPGTRVEPHFDRLAFKARVIFATLAADGHTANLKFTPEHQTFKIMLAPDVFQPVPGGWGRQGWTTINLAVASLADVEAALGEALALAAAKPKRRKI
jgi:hypothetical protein